MTQPVTTLDRMILKIVGRISMILQATTMTIETTVKIAPSAKADGFRYVRSEHVAVLSVSGVRSDPATPLRAVLQACFARFEMLLRALLHLLPHARLLLFTGTPFSAQHNALSRRRGLWAMSHLHWLSPGAARSPSVEVVGEHQMVRFAGLAEIVEHQEFDALEFARTNAGSFLTVTTSSDLTEERVRSLVAEVFLDGASEVNWMSAVAQVEGGEGYCVIRVSGGFDDREASIDAFLHESLLRNLEVGEDRSHRA